MPEGNPITRPFTPLPPHHKQCVNCIIAIWVSYSLLEGQLVLCYRYLSKPMQY